MSGLTHWIESCFQATGPWALIIVAAGSFVLGLSGALMPGPLLVAAIREGARKGAKAGPLLTLGHGLLEAALVAGIYFGLGGALAGLKPGTLVTIRAIIACVGGAALLLMGLMMLRDVRKVSAAALSSASPDDASAGSSTLKTVLAGAVVSLSNPYWSFWWVTIGAGYVLSAAALGLPGVAAFFTGHILSDLGWYWLVTLGVARGRRFLTDLSYRVLIAVCAALLIAFAASFLGMGIGSLAA